MQKLITAKIINMKPLLFAITILLLSSCMTTQKALDYLKDKKELAQICADEYPVKETFIKGDSVVQYDTLWGQGDTDTLYQSVKDTVFVTVTKTLPAKVITKVVSRTDTVVKENTALVKALQQREQDYIYAAKKDKEQIETLTGEVNEWKGKAKKRWWFMWLIVVACGVWTFRKPLLKLI